MAGMFGALGRALSNPDTLAAIGATLGDVGASMNGEQGGNVLALQKFRLDRQKLAQQQAIQDEIAGMLTPGFVPPQAEDPGMAALRNNPAVTGINGGASGGGGLTIGDSRLPGLALRAQQAGVNISNLLDVLKAQQPDIRYDRGFGYDGKTGKAAGGYHPDLEKGQEPLFDSNGRIVAVRNMDGSVNAAAEMAGAVEGAKARAAAPYQFETFTGPQGNPITVSRETAAALGSQGGLVARGQSPSEASAAKIRGDAAANVQVDMPSRTAAIDAAIELAGRLRDSPELKNRTGVWSMFPAMPGTPGVAWDAMRKQLMGQVFLDAYGELRGGGAITEPEGKKAEQAKARLEAAQTADDFKTALNDYIASLERGRDLMGRRAGQGGGDGYTARAPAGGGSAPPSRAAIEAEMRKRGLPL